MRFLFALLVALPVLVVQSSVASAADCAATSTGMTPLPWLHGSWRGHQGGLYPDGGDTPPSAYRQAGLAAAAEVRPVGGRTVLLSIGMSNATQEFSAFVARAEADPMRAPDVVAIDGAQGGQSADRWADPKSPVWDVVEQRLAQAGAGNTQVEVIWLKQADPGPTDVDAYVAKLTGELREIVASAAARYPNLRQVFVSPRTYGGYASSPLNPEPYAYATGFADKTVVADSVADPQRRPWVGWGPYLWTDGTARGPAGFDWNCADVQASDGTHPSDSGREKVAAALLAFFDGSEFTTWYRDDVHAGASGSPPGARWDILLAGLALAAAAGAATFVGLHRLLPR